MKSRFVAALLAFLLGTFGINEFYTRNYTRGIIDLCLTILFCWTGIVPAVITIINYVRAVQYVWCNSDEEFNEKYVVGYNNKIILND